MPHEITEEDLCTRYTKGSRTIHAAEAERTGTSVPSASFAQTGGCPAASTAAIFLDSQSLPSTRRETIMEAMVSPDAFRQVAGGSNRKPRVAIRGKASVGKPNMLTMSISPTRPPLGAPESTKALRMATAMAMA